MESSLNPHVKSSPTTNLYGKKDQTKKMKNYMNKNIDIRSTLKTFRKSLDQKYPDPGKKDQ
jgi:hypothetical protein